MRYVVHHDVLDAVFGQFAGNHLGHLFGVAIHAAIGNHYTRLGLVAAQTVVDVDNPIHLVFPHGTVSRADGFDLEAGQLLQGCLYGRAVFAHDVGVVAHHLVPIFGGVQLGVLDAAVESPEAAEGVAREERLGFIAIGHHGLRPVYHGREVEGERVFAHGEGIAVLHTQRVVVDAVVTLHHFEGFGVAHDSHVGIFLADKLDRGRVVGLHVVDDQIVDCAVSDNFGDVVQQTVGIGGIGRIDQNILFVGNQIGVVGNSVRERPKVLELVFTAVVDSYIVYSFCDFCYLHNPIKLTRYDINSNLKINPFV